MSQKQVLIALLPASLDGVTGLETDVVDWTGVGGVRGVDAARTTVVVHYVQRLGLCHVQCPRLHHVQSLLVPFYLPYLLRNQRIGVLSMSQKQVVGSKTCLQRWDQA